MATIQVKKFYQNTSGVKINDGVYNITDKRLSGLGQYLVDNDHAIVLEAETEVEAEYEAVSDEISLRAMTVLGLRQYADDNAVDLTGLTLKSDIIKAIEDAI